MKRLFTLAAWAVAAIGMCAIANAQTADEVDFGDDASGWSRNGECDDPRFTGKGMAPVTLEENAFADATDCQTLYERGEIRETR